ncbi:MAG: cobalamin-dependent protein [Armatimonadetes bacterium]|nr:cobalamin-dependent protein [Armatimonadota bacterium]MDE2205500.1 cobalamin-dependent protein [Armatimonadota bacterium]
MQTEPYDAEHAIRFVTAASIFDGHDAAINIIRRVLQASGAEVVHLGHNRSVDEIVTTAIQEDVQGVAVSSYQGGHMQVFRYLRRLLNERGGEHIQLFGGGGGVILPAEIAELGSEGTATIFSPEDGRRLGLQGMVNTMLRACDFSTTPCLGGEPEALNKGGWKGLASGITLAEQAASGSCPAAAAWVDSLPAAANPAPVVGITGTGGAGKSTLIDELLLRFLNDFEGRRIGILSIDPTRRSTGGALLGDRIRMNNVFRPGVYMRSLATRGGGTELSPAVQGALRVMQAAGFDLILVETSGIGQADAAITAVAGVTLYVMTPEFGAASQLEKIEMLASADLVAVNKLDRPGGQDALRYVRKQVQRNRGAVAEPLEAMPVYGVMASRYGNAGVSALFRALTERLGERWQLPDASPFAAPASTPQSLVPARRSGYLATIAQAVRSYHSTVAAQCQAVRTLQRLEHARGAVAGDSDAERALDRAIAHAETGVSPETRRLLDEWPSHERAVREADSGGERRSSLTLSGISIPRVATPHLEDAGELVGWLLKENLPGQFPFTAGVFAFKRESEEPKRQFAGSGGPERTNRRFHLLCAGEPARRLSTAFDPATLYGEDPDDTPDVYGRVGESGVSICTLDDMKKLYAGFDLCDPQTSVSMTINGPAPILLAMFFNTVIDQQMERLAASLGRTPDEVEAARVRAEALASVRGTVQADILKEDQAQNECIFAIDFALRMMGDVQQFCIDNGVRNYYTVSVSGFHMAEAGANPVSQLAFTLANAFTYLEYYLSRGMSIDAFAPSFSFFFSNGMDPEYSVLGRVARRIWAVALRDVYGANSRSQKLKYHIQTSGRSLHAQEIEFNDIRTTLQALLALEDNCNSLHTNAYDEAITTPTEESLRRAVAIQLILNKEFGVLKNENPTQGSFFIEQLTDAVEAAVLAELDRLHERGGVTGAMETQYQRGRIQDESLEYERRKQSGALPIVGVNMFLNPDQEKGDYHPPDVAVERAETAEKDAQIAALQEFHTRHAAEAPSRLAALKAAAAGDGNVFEMLMSAVRTCSLGQITHALYEVGGRYRRNM